MDSEIVNDFYVTLPSNSSAKYFPQNTQSSFRTKLIAPLNLTGEWDVGLSEVFIPRNWFNVNEHNNSYTVSFKTEDWVKTKYVKHKIELTYEKPVTIFQFCELLNNAISEVLTDQASVIFLAREETAEVNIVIHEGFEIDIRKENGGKLLYILHQRSADKIINSSCVLKYRPSTQYPVNFVFYIFNRNPKSVNDHLITNIPIKDDVKIPLRTVTDLINVYNYNLTMLELEKYVEFTYDPSKMELTANVADSVELNFTKESCPFLLKKLNSNENKIVIKGTQTFKIDPFVQLQEGEGFQLRIFEYYQNMELTTHYEELKLDIGMYKTPNSLLNAFKHIHISQLPDSKIKMTVPVTYEITMVKGLADMLGFEKRKFSEGIYTSKYPLEIDAGITEIFIYSDLVSNHIVGDSFSPLLRIIPCMTETSDQIVKNYTRPLYFPLRKNFIETIQIELKTSSGNNIVFSGGKTYVVLSFRRRKL